MRAALLTFSHDQEDSLSAVYKELKVIEDIFKKNQDVCTLDSRWKVRQQDIEDAFLTLQNRVRIFHFAGHAGPSILQLNQDEFTAKITFAGGLAANIGNLSRKSVKLVFLNGCATKDQAKVFLDKGIGAVIATNYPIRDHLAFTFAQKFYAAFCHRNNANRLGLQAAFDFATNAIKSSHGKFVLADGTISTSFVEDQHRGIAIEEEQETESYYLHLNPAYPDIGNETFADWMATKQAEAESHEHAVVAPHKAKSFGKSEKGYMLCNRDTESEHFDDICLQKIKGELPKPIFFIYHDKNLGIPHMLPERYRLFALPKHCPQSFFYQAIDLPKPSDFGEGQVDDQQNPDRDKFKWVLSDYFYKHFGGQPATSESLCQLSKRPSDEKLLMVHHKLDLSAWIDLSGDPAKAKEKDVRLRLLLDWYVKEYARALEQQLGKHLVIVLTAQYLLSPGTLPTIFQDLADRYPAQVFNKHQLDEINPYHVAAWQEAFLEDVTQSLFDPVEMFSAIDPNKMQLPLLKLKKALIAKIAAYNNRLHAAE